nr:hypothetical protein [Streptomyces anulatus]
MRCYAEGDAHDFPVEDETGAYCPEHGVTLLWRGAPITAVDLTRGAGADLGGLSAGPDDPYGVVCRSVLASGLPAAHALYRLHHRPADRTVPPNNRGDGR